MNDLSFSSALVDSRQTTQVTGQYVTFSSSQATYGLPIMAVREIRSWQPTTPLPGRMAASRGALNIRGAVVEVFDLAVMLGGPAIAASSGAVVLVLSHEDRMIGLLVESVSDIIQAGASDLMAAPLRTEASRGAALLSMVEDSGSLVGILDLDSLFAATV